MATIYSLFLGFLFTAVCSVNGDGSSVLVFSAHSHPSSRLEHSGIERSKHFTGINLLAQAASGSCFFPQKVRKTVTEWSSAKLNSLGSNSLIFLTRSPFKFLTVSQPRPSYSVVASSSIQSGLMSPVKILTIAMGGTNVRSECSSDDFCFFLGKRRSPSGDEDMKIKDDKILFASIRQSIIVIASKELGTREATGNNDGPRVEEYLRYTNLGKGYDWCAAFVSWSYGQAGLDLPRNPWSPALFPKARQIRKDQCRSADVFGIYGSAVKRIIHVGLVKEKQGQYLVTIEGNSNNRVESRRRHLKSIYAIADWVE
ncbi:hypothetical protein [Sphingobacterium tabacisoli]|uniref:CHAP domain-containing protein n=1 Tax=Sphingobacterium tabacisoli TaxID=2044855 RepID=A0ABW5L7T3_9SPHI|nr:hypothetical protein [Sphingobacterium tabacisoli]